MRIIIITKQMNSISNLNKIKKMMNKMKMKIYNRNNNKKRMKIMIIIIISIK